MRNTSIRMQEEEARDDSLQAIEDAIEWYWRNYRAHVGAEEVQAEVSELIENIDTRY